MHGHHAHAIAALLEDRRFGRLRGLGGDPQFLDEPAKRDPAVRFVLARELRHMQDVGERLLARGPQDQADVRARRVQQLLDGVGDGNVVPPPMQPLQQLQRVDDRLQMLGTARPRRLWIRNGWNDPKRCFQSSSSSSPIANNDPRSVANTDSSSSGHSIAASAARMRLDLFAIVERLAADEHVLHAARFQRLHVRHRHVVAKAR